MFTCTASSQDRTLEWEGWELRPVARKQNPLGLSFLCTPTPGAAVTAILFIQKSQITFSDHTLQESLKNKVFINKGGDLKFTN